MSDRLTQCVSAILGGVAFLLSTGPGNATDRTVGGDLAIDAKSFQGITKMTRVLLCKERILVAITRQSFQRMPKRSSN